MSGLEIAAFIVGILGPLQQTIQAAVLLRQQVKQCSENKQVIESTLATYQTLENRLQRLSEQCVNKSWRLSPSSRQIFHHDITTVHSSLQRAMLFLRDVESNRSSHSVFLRFVRASSLKDICRRLMRESLLLSHHIDRMQSLIFMCETFEHIAVTQSENLMSHLQFVAECQRDNVRTDVKQIAAKFHAAIQDKLNARDLQVPRPEERFRPSFRIKQRSSLRWLGSNAVDEYNFQVTSESRLKRAVLSNSIQRLRGSCHSPVIAAIGTAGMGKSAALCGLARDSFIQRQFSGGVYFIAMGRYASEREMTKRIASIVRSSGGAYVADEIRAADNLLLALGMAIRWFRGRDCLFLVRGVWANRTCSDIFSLLTRLPRDCSKGSAIIATSRNHLKDIESSVLFHPPDPIGSQAMKILLRSARFTEAEITSYSTKCWAAFAQALRLCNGIPVVLRMTGECVFRLSCLWPQERGQAWEHYLSLRNTRNSRSDEQGNAPVEAEGAKRGQIMLTAIAVEVFKGVWRDFTVDFAQLESTSMRMLRALCVLRGRQWVSFDVLQELWECDLGEAKAAVRLFSMICLMVEEKEGVWLEEALLKFAVREAKEHEGIEYWRSRTGTQTQ